MLQRITKKILNYQKMAEKEGKQEWRTMRKVSDKQQYGTNKPTILTIFLNICGLYTLIKRQKSSIWVNKEDPTIYCLQEKINIKSQMHQKWKDGTFLIMVR